MKKLIKYGAIIVSITLLVTLLTGCGKDEKKENNNNNDKKNEIVQVNDDNKVVATKTDYDTEIGNIKEKIEISLKDNKVVDAKAIYTFDNEESSAYMKEMLEMTKEIADEDDPFKKAVIEQNGTNITINLESDMFEETFGIEDGTEELNAENLRKALENDGFTIEK